MVINNSIGGDVEKFRRECEARWVLTQPFSHRKPYLDGVGVQRGLDAQRELEAEVIRQHKAMKEKQVEAA